MFAYTPEGLQVGQFHPEQGNMNFLSVIEDAETGNLFLGTWNDGLFEFDTKTSSFTNYRYPPGQPESNKRNNVYHLYQDADGHIWIGSWGGDLNLFDRDSETLLHYELTSGEAKGAKELYRDVLCIFKDRSGFLWAGTNGGGLCKIYENENQFGLIRTSNEKTGLSNDPVWSILKDHQDVLWVGSKGNNQVNFSVDGHSFLSLEIPEKPFSRSIHNEIRGQNII